MRLLYHLAAMAAALTAPAAYGATITTAGVSAQVASAASAPLQCVLSALTARGYPVRFIRGYGSGSVPHSLHPSGMALDVNQTSRGRTVPHMPQDEVTLARVCGAVSGASWRNNDSGHFQVGGYEGAGRQHHRRHRHGRRR